MKSSVKRVTKALDVLEDADWVLNQLDNLIKQANPAMNRYVALVIAYLGFSDYIGSNLPSEERNRLMVDHLNRGGIPLGMVVIELPANDFTVSTTNHLYIPQHTQKAADIAPEVLKRATEAIRQNMEAIKILTGNAVNAL
jgi:hypothetical protein